MTRNLLLAAVLLFSIPMTLSAQCTDLFFSEYIEGSSNNKALEIYNPTSSTIDLSDYEVRRNNNGAIAPSGTLSLQGMLESDSVYIIGNGSAISAITSQADTISTITFYNGDDAIYLVKISTGDTLDIIGEIGVDPGTNWTVGTGATSEHTLIRKSTIQQGQTDWSVGATEWDVFPQNFTDSLGFHNIVSCVTGTPFIAATTVDSNITCNGFLDGGATASATGGTMPYTYVWSNSATTASITGVAAGTYSVTVTDNNGTTDSSAVTITEPTSLVGASIVDSNITCNGFVDGGATASATGGTMPYTYVWSNSATTASITGVASGTYTVTITDANGCTDNSSVTITEPTALVSAVIVDSNVTVNGGTDGGATASATGGVMPYTYVWSNSATTASITGVMAGTYTVTITDANGCSNSDIATIVEPAPIGPLANLVISEISYNGPESGTDTSEFIEFVNIGATTVQLNNYTFSQGVIHTFGMNDSVASGQYFVIAVDSSAFRNSFGFNADAIWTSGGLSNSGEDIVIVDDIGRTVDSVDFDDNTPWPTSPDGGGFTLVLCDSTLDNNDGNNWNAANSPIAGQVINGLQIFANPGTGAICTSPLTTNTMVDSSISCNGGNNGVASVTVMGGNMPFTYLWSNAATTASINNLAAGQYFVTVTDVTSATAIDSVTVTEPSALIANLTVTNTSSSTSSDGAINSSATGGTPAYTYLWSTGATTSNITNLTTGTYTLTLTDANGCSVVNSTVVQGPAAVSISITGQDVTCNAIADGSASAVVTGGVSPYIFNWSGTPVGQSTNSISNLSGGQYFVTVTDMVGTTAVDSITINEPTAIMAALSATNVSAAGANDGAITSSVSGGTPGYTYLWSNGATTADITNLSSGNYTLTVTDSNGCLVVETEFVNAPGIIADLMITEINYNGPESGTDTSEFIEFYNNGTTTVLLDGYSFVEGVSHTFSATDSITAGQYFVVAFDSSAFRNRFGIEADAIWTSGGLSNGGEDITIVDNFGRTVDSVDFDDSTPWPANSGMTGPDGNGSSIELINLTSDNNDGANWTSSTLIVPGAVVNGLQVFASPGNPFTVGINERDSKEISMKVFPNPTRGLLTIELSTFEVNETIQLYNITGKLVMEQKVDRVSTTFNLDELSNGIYFLQIGNLSQKIIINK